MVVQKILFPKNAVMEKMYYRYDSGNVYFKSDNEGLAIDTDGGSVFFDTYFNMFSRKKWNKYTLLNNLRLTISIQGEAVVTLVAYNSSRTKSDKNIISTHELKCRTKKVFTIQYPDYKDELAVSFFITPVSDVVYIFDGAYETDVNEAFLPEIRLGLGICTYHREEYVLNNMTMLNREVFNNRNTLLNGKIKVYISDNGNSLNENAFSNKNIQIYPNKNCGGAGGFSRAAIEALEDTDFNPTHIVLMDDDISFEIDALERNYTFLRLLKKNARMSMIGGAMLRNDSWIIQHASGELFSIDGIDFSRCDRDMRDPKNVLLNDEEHVNHLAWWYCCIPAEILSQRGLAIPVFIKGDDIEFSMRNSDVAKITLNGVCCWHLPFDFKWSGHMCYYDYRNTGIVKSMSFPKYSGTVYFNEVFRAVITSLLRYSYSEANLMIRGATDFLKGPLWLCETDPVKLNENIMCMADHLCDISESEKHRVLQSIKRREERIKPMGKKASIIKAALGWFLFANRRIYIELGSPEYFYRIKEVVKYDKHSGKVLIARKNYREAIYILFRLLLLRLRIFVHFKSCVRQYRLMHRKIVSKQFWKKYLRL